MQVQVPSTLHIRIGFESLRTRRFVDRLAEAREFEYFAMEAKEHLTELVREVNMGDENTLGILAGYLLGLETARAMLALNPTAVTYGVKI